MTSDGAFGHLDGVPFEKGPTSDEAVRRHTNAAHTKAHPLAVEADQPQRSETMTIIQSKSRASTVALLFGAALMCSVSAQAKNAGGIEVSDCVPCKREKGSGTKDERLTHGMLRVRVHGAGTRPAPLGFPTR